MTCQFLYLLYRLGLNVFKCVNEKLPKVIFNGWYKHMLIDVQMSQLVNSNDNITLITSMHKYFDIIYIIWKHLDDFH